MITFLEGTLVEKNSTRLVVAVGGVGFVLHAPLFSLKQAGEPGDSIKILTHLQVREDGLALYGFMTHEERRLFELLLSVSGLGPRLALAILSSIEVETFVRTVLTENLALLTKIPGIGKKIAQRIILELKEPLSKSSLTPTRLPTTPSEADSVAIEEAVLALVALGHSRAAAQVAVAKVVEEKGHHNVNELITQALTLI